MNTRPTVPTPRANRQPPHQMGPSPPQPASIPTRMKSGAMGTPVRCDARLNTTLTPSRTPQVVRRRAVACGSFAVIGEVSPEWGTWLRPGSRAFHADPHNAANLAGGFFAADGGNHTWRR